MAKLTFKADYVDLGAYQLLSNMVKRGALEIPDADIQALIDATVTTGTQIKAVYPQAAQQVIASGAGGAINVTSYLTTVSVDAGGDAYTLANGTVIGQLKSIRLTATAGGTGVITPANLAAGTTITLTTAKDSVLLQWNGTDWVVLDANGATVA